MKKRIFLISIVLIAIIKINNISYGTDQTQQFNEVTIVNPNYSNVLTETNVESMIKEDEKDSVDVEDKFLTYNSVQLKSTYKGQSFYETEKAAGNYVKNKMKNRIKEVTVRYETTNSDFQDVATSIVKKAISEELAKYSDEGDYLAWSYGGYTVGGGYYHKGNKYYWILNYTFTYYTTYQQEVVLDGRIQSFLKNINIKKESQYSLIKQINDYICSNTEYDYEHLPDSSYKPQFTAYAALINGKAVCQGYATLYYRMLKECGIDNRIIVSATHSWNIVKIGNLYYNVDGVWNDGVGNDKYLLAGNTDFVNDTEHIRNSEYNTKSFNNKYPMAQNKFEVKVNQINNLRAVKTTNNEISLKWDVQDNVMGYQLYKYNYDEKCWEYYKRIKGSKNNGAKVSGLNESTVNAFKVRAYTTIDSQKKFGTYSSTLKTTTAPNSTTLNSITSTKAKILTVKWKKIMSSNGYQVQIATNSSFTKDLKTYTIKDKRTNTKVIKGLKSRKKYYCRVRSYRTYLENKYYSSWSNIRSVKCK